jgi:hypothetical protein
MRLGCDRSLICRSWLDRLPSSFILPLPGTMADDTWEGNGVARKL